MIELQNDRLRFSFPDVHDDAHMSLSFMRTLRIPDDGDLHYLPPGFSNFPLRHVDDYSERVPTAWHERGGVMMPMFQSEAMWISFLGGTGYPFIVKVATGKINAVTGDAWTDTPNRDPQDYMVLPNQPWLDGYSVAKGEVRQFVAMPLGKGYTAEEQITGEAEHGGVQIVVYPMKAKAWKEIFARERLSRCTIVMQDSCRLSLNMGLAPGGRMKQKIYDDPHTFDVWDLRNSSRCFVHITNSIAWRAITGSAPPTMPPTAKQYTDCGLPWFDYYTEGAEALDGSEALHELKSVVEMSVEKGEIVLPENESAEGAKVARIVREG